MRKRSARLAVGTILVLAIAPSTAMGQEISFAPLDLYPRAEAVSGEADHLATGDLDGDGRADVVVADGAAPGVQVWLAQPDGTLGTPTPYPFDARRGVRLVDVNGDDDLDLVLAGADALRVALGGAGGTFGAATIVGPPVGGVEVVADFNADGDPDLAARDEAGVNVLVLLGDAGGTFGAPTPYLVGDPGTQSVLQVLSADFNGDDDPDLVAALPNRVVVLIGGAGGSFSESARFEPASFPAAIGDFNGDGDPDLVTTGDTGTVVVRLGLAGSGFGAPTTYSAPFPLVSMFALDLDQDGDDDLVQWAPSFNQLEPGQLIVLPGDPSGQLGAPEPTTIPQIASQPVFADFNGDGDPDLAFMWSSGEGPDIEVSIRAGAAGTTFGTGPTEFVGFGFFDTLTTDDFNGDDRPDVALLASLVAQQPGDPEGPVLGIWLNTTAVDKTPPKIVIRVPKPGAKYRLGQTVLADYECIDRESAVTSCVGTVPDGAPIDTSSLGHKTFRVTTVSAGGTTTRKRHYKVVVRHRFSWLR